MPDESADARPIPAPQGEPAASVKPDGPVRWRVDGRLTAFRIAGACLLAIATLTFVTVSGDRMGMVLCGLGTLLLGGYALRDIVAPVRLAADRDGVTVVVGYARHERLPWAQIERVRLDQRRRLGTRAELVEIDTGEDLYLFSQYDLGARPDEVVEVLRTLRS